MPYELETEKLSHKFFNVTPIAVLFSLGLHLLVYKYGFPTLLFKEKSNHRDKTVATIELSPVEQARLPDIESNWSVPQFKNTPLDEAAPPFALPLPPNFTPSANLPPVPIPSGYNFPDLPSVSSNIELPPLGITDLSALPSPPPMEDLDSLTPPPDQPLTTPEKSQNSKPPAEKPPTPKPPEVKAPPELEETEKRQPTPKQIAAARQQKLTGNLRDVSISLRQQNIATTDEEARRNYVNWLSKIEDVKPETLDIKGIYPRDACIRKLEGKSVYGVSIDAKNRVIGLELIKGAKYPLFNEQAGKDIQKHAFVNKTQKTKPYQVTVDYQYDREICPSLTLPSLREKEQPLPALAPKPEVESKPVPAPKPEAETLPTPAPEAEPEAESKPAIVPEPLPAPEPEAKPVPEPTPTPEAKPEAESKPAIVPEPLPAPKPEAEQQPSLRERLQNTPLPDSDTVRERLQKEPLPKQK